jgi:uncharacterized protein YjbJ (UPF0337 family)
VGRVTNPINTEEVVIRDGTKEQARGKVDQAKGKVKEVAGRATGNRKTEARGKTDRAKGNLKQARGKGKDAVQKVKKSVRGALN